MTQTNKIDVTLFPADQSNADLVGALEFHDVNYISFVSSPGAASSGTYGIPAILSDAAYKSDGYPLKVLYVNPANIVAMEAWRKA